MKPLPQPCARLLLFYAVQSPGTGKGLRGLLSAPLPACLLYTSCIDTGKTLETLTLEAYKSASACFEEDVYSAISLETCVNKRRSQGGTAPERVREQIAWVRERLRA